MGIDALTHSYIPLCVEYRSHERHWVLTVRQHPKASITLAGDMPTMPEMVEALPQEKSWVISMCMVLAQVADRV